MLQSTLRLSNNDNDSESETLSSLPSRTSRSGVVTVLLLVFFILAGLPVIYRMEIAPPISQSIVKMNLTKGEIKTTFSPEGFENTSRVDLPEIAWLMSYPNSVRFLVCFFFFGFVASSQRRLPFSTCLFRGQPIL